MRPASEGESAEILVVDNCSRDGSAEIVTAEFSGSGVPVRLIRSDVNLGFGVANNRAIEAARDAISPYSTPTHFSFRRARPRHRAHGIRPFSRSRWCAARGARWRLAAFGAHVSIVLRMLLCLRTRVALPRSRFFSAAERTWADPAVPATWIGSPALS